MVTKLIELLQTMEKNNDNKRTAKENLERFGLENTTCSIGNINIDSPDAMADKQILIEQYQTFLTEPRR